MQALAITQGDSAGIGPEIIAKAFRDAPQHMQGCFVVGELDTLRRAAQCIAGPGRPSLPVALIASPEEALATPPRCMPVLVLPGLPGPAPFGVLSADAGRAAAQCVVWAARAMRRVCTFRATPNCCRQRRPPIGGLRWPICLCA